MAVSALDLLLLPTRRPRTSAVVQLSFSLDAAVSVLFSIVQRWSRRSCSCVDTRARFTVLRYQRNYRSYFLRRWTTVNHTRASVFRFLGETVSELLVGRKHAACSVLAPSVRHVTA